MHSFGHERSYTHISIYLVSTYQVYHIHHGFQVYPGSHISIYPNTHIKYIHIFLYPYIHISLYQYIHIDMRNILTCKIWCHCLYHASTKSWPMVTHMQLAYISPATRSEILILLGGHEYDTIHVLLQADMSRLGRYLKPPTHLQFYYLFEICKVELSKQGIEKKWPINNFGLI